MQPTDKPKPKRIRAPKPRTPPLRRGQACLNCKHLKIKCDGVQPICGNCARVPKPERCRFAKPASRRQSTERAAIIGTPTNIDSEVFAGSSTALWLVGTGVDEFSDYRSPPVEFPTPGSAYSDLAYDSTSPPSETFSEKLSIESNLQDPSVETIQLLLQWFLPSADQLGFFLHVDRFRKAALTPPAMDSISFEMLRPSRSLLYAVYLWGAHLSHPGNPLFELAPHFLRRALECISTEACAQRDTMHAVQTIQAHVLLAQYFMTQRRFLSARVHASGAATLTLGYRLHKLGNATNCGFTAAGVGDLHLLGLGEVMLRQPQDAVEEGEWIRAFWAVVGLQVSLNLVSPGGSGPTILDCVEGEINTPWPMHMLEYEMQLGQMRARAEISDGSADVVKTFLADEYHFMASSVASSHAQAAVLLHQAMQLVAKWSSSTLQPTDFSAHTTAYARLTQRLAQFTEALPPVGLYPPPDIELVLAHALAGAAGLHLHRAFASTDSTAHPASIHAVRALLHTLSNTPPLGLGTQVPVMQPALTTICALACRVLVDEIQTTQTLATLGVSTSPGVEYEPATLGLNLQEGMRIMGVFALGKSSLAEHQLAEIQSQYNALYGSL